MSQQNKFSKLLSTLLHTFFKMFTEMLSSWLLHQACLCDLKTDQAKVGHDGFSQALLDKDTSL